MSASNAFDVPVGSVGMGWVSELCRVVLGVGLWGASAVRIGSFRSTRVGNVSWPNLRPLILPRKDVPATIRLVTTFLFAESVLACGRVNLPAEAFPPFVFHPMYA